MNPWPRLESRVAELVRDSRRSNFEKWLADYKARARDPLVAALDVLMWRELRRQLRSGERPS